MSYPLLFETKQVQSAMNSNTFTAQEAGFFSNAKLTNFWNRASFTKHSDTTLTLLGKAASYDFLAASEQHPTDFYSPPNRNRFKPYNVSRVGLQNHLLKIAPLFAPEWFADANFALFGFPRYIFTEGGINFSILLFVQHIFIFFLKIYKSTSIRYRIHANMSVLSFLAIEFVNFTTPKAVTDFQDAEREKHQRKTLQHFDEPLKKLQKLLAGKFKRIP